MSDARYMSRIIKTGDPLTELDLMIIVPRHGRNMQLRFRVPDQISQRTIALIFRDLANKMEIASDPRRYSEEEALIRAREARVLAQARLDTISKPGRKKRLE